MFRLRHYGHHFGIGASQDYRSHAQSRGYRSDEECLTYETILAISNGRLAVRHGDVSSVGDCVDGACLDAP